MSPVSPIFHIVSTVNIENFPRKRELEIEGDLMRLKSSMKYNIPLQEKQPFGDLSVPFIASYQYNIVIF